MMTDDVPVFGTFDSQCWKRLQAVRNRLESIGYTTNETKSGTNIKQIYFQGYTTSVKKVQTEDRNVNKILNMLPFSNVKEVEQFLGLVNFHRRVIPSFTTRLSRFLKFEKLVQLSS